MHRSALVAVLCAAVAASCLRAPLPIRLAGLHRTHIWSGARAVRLMAQLHAKEAAPRDSTVADYGRDGQLRVWLSRYPDGVEAERVLTRMVDGMRTGRTPFAAPRVQGGASGRWLTVGPGGHSVLWASGRCLFWLQGEPDAVMRAADELPAPSHGQLT